jgi:hypothetical protein
VALGSIAKVALLGRLLGANVAPFRLPLLFAIGVSLVVGMVATRWVEWAELLIGVPLIAASYLIVLWRFAFGPEDRALFRKAGI